MDNTPQTSAFKSTIFKIITGSASQPFYVHADVLARSDLLRRPIAGPWKESIDRAIDWSEWDSSVVEKFVQWLYTDDYTCPYPTLIEIPTVEDADEEEEVGFVVSDEPSCPDNAFTQKDNAKRKAGASEGLTAKKQKLLPLKDLSWNGKAKATKLTQSEEFEKWSNKRLWISEELDYGATFSTHAEIYVMGRRYMLDELSNMAWDRLRAVLQTIDRPIAGSRVITNVMNLVLDTYDKIGNPDGGEEPLKELITTFVALNSTAFQGSGIEDWANSENSTARDFIADLMGKLMLRVKELEEGTSTASVPTAPPSTIGSGGFVWGRSSLPNPAGDTRTNRGNRNRW